MQRNELATLSLVVRRNLLANLVQPSEFWNWGTWVREMGWLFSSNISNFIVSKCTELQNCSANIHINSKFCLNFSPNQVGHFGPLIKSTWFGAKIFKLPSKCWSKLCLTWSGARFEGGVEGQRSPRTTERQHSRCSTYDPSLQEASVIPYMKSCACDMNTSGINLCVCHVQVACISICT